jgi:hypothetical protein
MPWFVLKHPTGYLGQEWEIFNGAARRPRTTVVPLQKATICPNRTDANIEKRRGRQILGLDFVLAEVLIEGRGDEARIRLAGS